METPRRFGVQKLGKGDSHFGKSATVTIFYEAEDFFRGYWKNNNNQYQGTFKVNDGKCEIRLKNDQKTYRLIPQSKMLRLERTSST